MKNGPTNRPTASNCPNWQNRAAILPFVLLAGLAIACDEAPMEAPDVVVNVPPPTTPQAPTPTSVCGDTVCDGVETVSTCPGDCAAPPPDPGPGSDPPPP